MNTKTNKRPALKKQHFEILLEDIQGSVKAIAEGHSVLNNKIDKVSNELHETKNELIYLIKAAVDSSEQRLTKKIEDGDRAVMAHVDHRFDETNQKIDEINITLGAHTVKLDEHDERISRLEHKN